MDDHMNDSKKFPIYQFRVFVIGILIIILIEIMKK